MDINKPIIRHIEANIFKYIIVLTFFVAGVVVGVANSFSPISKEAAGDITSVFENLPEVEFDTVQIMKTSFFKNSRCFFLIFVGGLSIWLLPISFSAIFICGFSYGYTVACMTGQMGGIGFAVAFASIATGLLITVPLSVMLCVIAINHSIDKKHKYTSSDRVGYVVCSVALFLANLIVVPADSLLVIEIIRQICASAKL